MKIIQLIALIAISFFTSTEMMAAAHSAEMTLKIKLVEDAKAQPAMEVQVQNLQKRWTNVSIQDLDGQNYFREVVKEKTNYANLFLLEKLPAKTYIMVIQNKNQTLVRAFAYHDGMVTLFQPKDGESIAKARQVKRSQEGKVIVNFQSYEYKMSLRVANLKFMPTTIQLVHPNEGVAFESNLNKKAGLSHVFNFEGLKYGTYFMLVQHPEHTEIQMIRYTRAGVELLDSQVKPRQLKTPIIG